MADAFTINVDESDWSVELSGWRCTVLTIPGAEVEAVYTKAGLANDSWYEINKKLGIVRWVETGPAPEKATLAIKLTKELSTQELTSKWKKLAVLLPFIATILVSTLPYFLRPRQLPINRPTKSDASLWTIKGTVRDSRKFQPFEVDAVVKPPDFRLREDFTFEAERIPIAMRSDGLLELPSVIFRVLRPGFNTPVVHLLNPGETVAANVEDYELKMDATNHVIDIKTPIEFKIIDTPFNPTQKAIPLVEERRLGTP